MVCIFAMMFLFELIERQNLLADVSSVAIFAEVSTLATHVSMEDGGGSNPSSSPSGVGHGGGKGPRVTHQWMDDVRSALEAPNGKRVAVPGWM